MQWRFLWQTLHCLEGLAAESNAFSHQASGEHFFLNGINIAPYSAGRYKKSYVIEIIGKSQYHSQNRTQQLYYNILWQIVTCIICIVFNLLDSSLLHISNVPFITVLAGQMIMLERLDNIILAKFCVLNNIVK